MYQFYQKLKVYGIIIIFGCISAEVFTFTLVGIIGAIGSSYFGLCYFKECCPYHVPYNISKLENLIENNLFGQPLVNDIMYALESHKHNILMDTSEKALTLSFHGWPGIGKNFVTNMITESLFTYGFKSKFVKMYNGGHYKDPNLVYQNREKIKKEIESIVSLCRRALIIIDEVDEMASGVLDILKPMVDFNSPLYKEAVFIFITNIGGDDIVNRLIQLDKPRNNLILSDFEDILRKTSFQVEGGFKETKLISSHLIDYYVPFLPLEQDHVYKCINTEFKNQNIRSDTKAINAIISTVTFGPPNSPIYANSGCKRIKKQVGFYIKKSQMNYQINNHKSEF